MATSGTSPREDELKTVLVALRAQNPSLGIAKLHALLLSTHPEWTVSEKRTRKILQSEGLVLTARTCQNEGAFGTGPESERPVSKVMEGLDLSKWSSKVEVRFFGKSKGKGLIAKEHIAAGETLWKEDPFILAPEWDIYDLQTSSLSCAYCSTPLSDSALVVRCAGSQMTPQCHARFCSRLCLSRSARTHPLLCPSQNPASGPLLLFARQNQWMALHALAQCTARILLANQLDEAALKADWEVVRSLAQLGMEERAKGGWLGDVEPDRATWKRAYQLFIQAFQAPVAELEKKKLSRLLKKPLSKEVADEIFNYDAFLWGLGRMSLNLEAHGGLYVLHSHLNHSCSPNVSVRHFDQRTALSRITLVARTDIEPGDELFITYVNPELPLEQRRRQVLEWGFGTCKCTRCITEENDPHRKLPRNVESDDLERELKAGLGVM